MPGAVTAGTGELIEDLIATWGSMREAVASLPEDDWTRPTELPGWSIQDVVSHVASIEAMLLGYEEPEHEAPAAEHVRNPLGEWNEQRVDRRRSWSPGAVLEEFDATTRERARVMRALCDQELDEIVATPLGVMPVRDFLRVRLLDSWLHEQDIRRAAGLPETLDTSAAARVLDMILEWLPRAVAKAGVADGDAVRVHITGPSPRRAAVRMVGGRGVTEADAASANLQISAQAGPFIRVATGRLSSAAAVATGSFEVDGDRELGERVLARINRVP
jgi:uncharacterized protein (TIGR03083 family)